MCQSHNGSSTAWSLQTADDHHTPPLCSNRERVSVEDALAQQTSRFLPKRLRRTSRPERLDL